MRQALVLGAIAPVRVTAEAAAGLPWYPGQVTLEATEPDAPRVAELTGGHGPAAARAAGAAGRTGHRSAGPATPRPARPPDRPVQRLLCGGPAAPGGRPTP